MRYLLLAFAALLAFSSVSVAADMTVFGIELGKPLELQKCPAEAMRGIIFEDWPKENVCVTVNLNRKFGYDAEVREIRFADNEVPAFVKGRFIIPLELNGVLEGIEFFTFGIRDQEVVLGALSSKYGKPAKYKKVKSQNRMGASFETISAEWVRSGVWVEFEGAYGEIVKGRVTIDTNTGHTARSEWFKKRFGHKREL